MLGWDPGAEPGADGAPRRPRWTPAPASRPMQEDPMTAPCRLDQRRSARPALAHAPWRGLLILALILPLLPRPAALAAPAPARNTTPAALAVEPVPANSPALTVNLLGTGQVLP